MCADCYKYAGYGTKSSYMMTHLVVCSSTLLCADDVDASPPLVDLLLSAVAIAQLWPRSMSDLVMYVPPSSPI